MPKLEISDDCLDCKITSDTPIPYDDGDVTRLISAISGMNFTIPMDSLKCQKESGYHSYTWKAADGREWNDQKIYNTVPQTQTTPEPGDAFTSAELQAHTRLRDVVGGFIVQWGLTKLVCNWS